MKLFRVLVFDEDPNTQQVIRKAFYASHLDWEMVFTSSREETIDSIENKSYDALVSNVSGADSSEVELFFTAYEKRPEMLRFALTNPTKKETRIELAKYVHQCVAKPFEGRDLISLLQKTLNNGSLLEHDDLKRLIGKIKSLPTLPRLYTQITEEINSTNVSLERIGKMIENDPAMCAKVLQLVNSAFFGLKQNVINPTQAITFLGVETIRDLVLTCDIFSQFNPHLLKHLGLSFLWDHSISVSGYARAVTRAEQFSKSMIGHACTAGLLHDIGKLIFAQNFPTAYQIALYQAKKRKCALVDVEIESFGASHAEVGAFLLKRWGLPTLVVSAVGFHHFPERNPTSDFSPTTAVHAANYFDLIKHPFHGVGINELDQRYLLNLKMANHVPMWETCCS